MTDKEFRELCGFYEKWWDGSASMRDYYPDGKPMDTDVSGNPIYPALDLNNLFKYAVLPLIGKNLDAYYKIISMWHQALLLHHEPFDPAQALKEAISKILTEAKR